jgi:RES domain-containing protein
MSRYSRERIESRVHLFAIEGAHRVFGVSRMPLQPHSAPSRFCDGKSGFSVLYASLSFETCIIETLVRDRFTHRLKRELPLAAVLARGYARLSTQPEREVNLLDLRDTGCVDIGAPTDAVRARHFAAGQALGKAVYEEHPDVDGFIYVSRLTEDDCIAVFDRAVEKFAVVDACELKDHAELPAVLERNRVVLVD